MKTNNLSIIRNLAVLAALGAIGCTVDDEISAMDEELDQAEWRIDGEATTGFAPVIRIQNSYGYSCSAVAISDDLVATALHCLGNGSSQWASWAKVSTAHGANSGAVNKRSSATIVQRHDWNDPDSFPNADFALLKFADGTFSEYYEAVHTPMEGDDIPALTFVGFGTDGVKRYDPSEHTSGLYSTNNVFTTHSSDYDHGDSGGPLLQPDGEGGYEVIGVLSSTSGEFEGINDPLEHLLLVYAEYVDDQCIDVWKGSNETDQGMSFCLPGWIEDNTEDYVLEDFHGTGNDAYNGVMSSAASSVRVPDGAAVTLWTGSNNTGSFRTFQNIFGFGATETVNLSDYDFNDDARGIALEWDAGGAGIDWTIRSRLNNRCINQYGGLSSCSSSQNLKFSLEAQGGGWYLIRSRANTNKCLSSANSSLSTVNCNTSDTDQRWAFKNNTWTGGDPQDFMFGTSVYGKQILSCPYTSTSNGLNEIANFRMCDGDSTPSQMFYLDMR
ncbi:MAG: trypsin-like serine protease [Myxococcota bacterium]